MKAGAVNHRARMGDRRSLVLLSLLVAALPSSPWSAEETRPEPVDLPTLAELVIAHDPALEALRGAMAAADFRVAMSGRGRSPEVRARYGESSSWSLPDPYTERSTETLTDTSTEESALTRTDQSFGVGEVSSVTESVNQGGSTTRETVRTVTPDREGVSIHETVTEYESGQFAGQSGSVDQLGVSTTRDENGAFTRQVVSESVERRDYGRDVYGGGSSYAVQLRLFPKNRFLSRSAREREEAVRTHAELRLESALQRAALSVARDHREIQFMVAELRVMQRRAKGLKAALVDVAEREAAHAIRPDEYHRRRTESLIYLSRLRELRRSIVDAATQLKRRAGLDGARRIAFAGSLYPPRADLDRLDRSHLVELALPRHAPLGALRAARSTLASDLRAHRAESLPWVSFISVDYGEDEGVNGQTRDEWSVYAGVSLPVGAWLDGSPRRALETQLGSIERQGLLTRHNLELKIDALCRSLEAAQADWLTFERSARDAKADIARRFATIAGDDLVARRTRLALNESLIDMELQRLNLARTVSRLLFELCDTVGCDLTALLAE